MFYDKLININLLESELPFGTSSQFREVRRRAFSILTNSLMAVVFERLPKEHLEEFARRFAADSSDPALMGFLSERVPSIEDDLRQEFQNVLHKLKPLLDTIDDTA